MRFLGLIHVLALCLSTYHILRPLRLPWPSAVTAGFVLVWANLVLTAQALSLVSGLGSVWLFLSASMIIALGTAGFVRWLEPGKVSIPTSDPVATGVFRYENELILLMIFSGLALLCLNGLIAATHLASNPDTIVYRFARAYWYVTQGSFAHFANGTDPRVVYYPTNGTTLYIPFVLYRFNALAFNLPTLVAWCVIPLTTYSFARDLGAARLWGVGAAWAIALTPNVLIQALSTNDEILAAAGLLAGLYFLHRWVMGSRPLDLLLGAAGVCLSVGTKLHVFFYWPYSILLTGISFLAWRKWASLVRGLANVRSAAVLLSCSLFAVAFAFSFIIYNLIATGQVTDVSFASQVLNTPFDPAVSLQTIAVYAMQIALSPIPDLSPFAGYSGARISHYDAFNAFFQPLLGWVDNGPSYTSVGYRITGMVSSSAFLFNEQTVMIGFSWLACLVATIWLLTHRGRSSPWALWIALALPAWFLCWASSTKYIEGIAVYVAYAAIISSPAWAFAFGPIASIGWSRARWAILSFVALTHVLTAVSIMGLNTSRSASAALSGRFTFPRSVAFTVDPSVTDELKLAREGITHHTIDWGQPNWVFMAFNPEIPQRLQSTGISYPGDSDGDPDSRTLAFSREVLMPRLKDGSLHVYPIRQIPAFGHAALRLSNPSTPGLTKIGELQFALGPEWVFAAGNGVEKRHPGDTGYLVFSFNEVSDFGHDPKPLVEIQSSVLGLGRTDDLSFKLAIKVDNRLVEETDWMRTPSAKLSTRGMNAENGVLMISVRNNTAGGTIDTVDVRLRSSKPPTQ